jgi:RNA polymerase sigma-70 factor (ECF subfamily)
MGMNRSASPGVTGPDAPPRKRGKVDWEAVYRAVYPDVLRYLSWMIWDEERAKDLAQEAFARVLGRDADNPRGLVFRTASNLAHDEARLVVRRRRHLKLLRVEEDVREEEVSTPALELEKREREERLRRAMERLSETDREVLLLWNAGLSYVEIAEQTGLAQASLGTTIARAKRKLVEAHDALEGTDAALG